MDEKLPNFEKRVQEEFNKAFYDSEHRAREFTETQDAKTLVIMIHGYDATRYSLRFVWFAAREAVPSADFFLPDLPLNMLSFEDPIAVINELIKKVDLRQREHRYDHIIIVGHSIGALLARKLYIHACGEPSSGDGYQQLRAPFESGVESRNGYAWAEKIDRLVLLAGMNLGWSISQHMNLWTALKYKIGVAFGKYIMTPLVFFRTVARFSAHGLDALSHPMTPLIFTLRRGATFLTNLRVQWIVMRERAGTAQNHDGDRTRRGSALVVQMLGTIDDIVSPDDNVDLVTGQDFVYIDVAKTGHVNILQLDPTEIGSKRAQHFVNALTLPKAALMRQTARITAIDAPQRNDNVKHVVFIIHGIRDLGFWTTRIARRVKAIYPNPNEVESVTASYGYFPMLSFLFLGRRREKVVWLMDRYAEALATYPNADFHFFGHSNGTYLLARSFRDYPFCRFKHVAFAGSVVRTDYGWDALIRDGRIKTAMNYVCTNDYIVAWFPRLFEPFKRMDLGGAGFHGFKEMNESSDRSKLNQINYVHGGHSAATQEDNWESIGEFLINGTPPTPPTSLYRTQRSLREKIGGKLGIVIWGAILLAIYKIYGASTFLMESLTSSLGSAEIQILAEAGITLLVVYKILTKV
jgi:pimeloyl-ACP methyl ester carboxylesterase